MSLNIKDIARLAGTSHMTVSRVINNSDNVKLETREKVLKVIQENNFIPSASARALISGKSHTIGLLITYDLKQFPADFLPPILEGIFSELNENGYNVMLFFDQINGRKNIVPMNLLNKNQLDGLFVLSVEKENEVIKKIKMVDLPIVFINQKVNVEGVSYVVTDDCDGAYKAVTHLIELGHTNIGILGGTEKYNSSRERHRGYELALKKANLPVQPDLYAVGNFDRTQGYLAAKELLARRKDITAIFAANDFMALGAYKAIKEIGLKIPEDISVIGYDNQEFCEFVEPELTTIRKHRRIMGKNAASVMLQSLNNENIPQKIVLKTDLVIRNSTAKLKK